MDTGLALIYNGEVKAATLPTGNQWLTLGISAVEDVENIAIAFQRLKMPGDKSSTVFYYSKIVLHDVIRIKVKKIEAAIEPRCDYVNYLNFIRLQRYGYLRKVINNSIETDNSIGFKLRVNDRAIKIFMLKNRSIGLVVNQNKDGVNLSIGATDKASDVLYKDKSWFSSSLCLGDEISIKLTFLKEESPAASEYDYEVKKPMSIERVVEDYNHLQAELTKAGILKRRD
jgi:hypothetical protein